MCSSCRGSLSRRQLLRGLALAGGASLVPARVERARATDGDGDGERIVLERTVAGMGTYTYLPFAMPPGVSHIHGSSAVSVGGV